MKTDSSTVVQNLSASRMRIVGTNSEGAEQFRCTIGEFVSANINIMRPRQTWVNRICISIATFGEMRLNLGCHGIFTLRAE